ncbi:MAG TPA: NlpC/P60 family protein [Acidimicrobiales bacterium]|nr:NlpC/P60 family protein [Acidimicrobiales bacterium]
MLCCSLLPPARPAGADPLASTRARAGAIAARLSADQARLDAVSQQYDAAQQRVSQLDGQLASIKSTVGADKAAVVSDQATLRQEAIHAYMTGATDSDLSTLFSSGAESVGAATEYRAVASGAISDAIDALGAAQTRLAAQEATLQSAQASAQAALSLAGAARRSAMATVADQEATLGQLKGRIATLVSEEQTSRARASHAAFVNRIHGAALPNLPAAGGAARAIAAAESQEGVPYRWGGESPGSGFDCSGLTQWSWAQAGVSLPRTAAAQYGAIPHVSLSALEPGDLVFWSAGGGISHVGMYVGGGDVINAPTTGEVVRIQPIWNSGLVGAGRP